MTLISGPWTQQQEMEWGDDVDVPVPPKDERPECRSCGEPASVKMHDPAVTGRAYCGRCALEKIGTWPVTVYEWAVEPRPRIGSLGWLQRHDRAFAEANLP